MGRRQLFNMADGNRAPLYGVAVLFLAFLMKDYLLPSDVPTEDSSIQNKEIPSVNMNRFAGPSIKFSFCYSWGYRKVYEQYAAILQEKYPLISIEGDNYPPPFLKLKLSHFLGIFKMLLILAIVAGTNVFEYLGLETPSVWTWTQQNKFYACLMIFFLCNAVESQLISTGAFEILFNDVPLWSKLETGRIPQPAELFQMIDNHLSMSPKLSFEAWIV